ncbi:MAG TPA: NUDIX domain-containing protein [Nocardioidaceae bacterium]|nr:NUDIX domain-containing protein [Nocardioidaceae bacterium]
MAQSPRRPPDVIAAGAVVTRKGGDVLLVHRPKYDDWSFPKGKLDPGEHVTTAAVREVGEETGLDIRLGPPLRTQRYWVTNGERRVKRVYYWVARVVGDDDVSTYHVNDEIDEVAWVPLEKAREKLDYDYDRATLEEHEQVRKKSYPLVILRHGRAKSRKAWHKDDRERPLTKAGTFQAEQVVPVLGAYGVSHILTSSSRRCWATVAPYADVTGLEMEDTDDLSEEDATPETVAEQVRTLLDLKEASVLCTHRPVLPWVFEALGLEPQHLAPGSVFVVHHRKGRILATEHHDVSFR